MKTWIFAFLISTTLMAREPVEELTTSAPGHINLKTIVNHTGKKVIVPKAFKEDKRYSIMKVLVENKAALSQIPDMGESLKGALRFRGRVYAGKSNQGTQNFKCIYNEEREHSIVENNGKVLREKILVSMILDEEKSQNCTMPQMKTLEGEKKHRLKKSLLSVEGFVNFLGSKKVATAHILESDSSMIIFSLRLKDRNGRVISRIFKIEFDRGLYENMVILN